MKLYGGSGWLQKYKTATSGDEQIVARKSLRISENQAENSPNLLGKEQYLILKKRGIKAASFLHEERRTSIGDGEF